MFRTCIRSDDPDESHANQLRNLPLVCSIPFDEIFFLTDSRSNDRSPLAIPRFLAQYFLKGQISEVGHEAPSVPLSRGVHSHSSARKKFGVKASLPGYSRRSAVAEAFRRRYRKLRREQLSNAAAAQREARRQVELDLLGSSALATLQWEPSNEAAQFSVDACKHKSLVGFIGSAASVPSTALPSHS